MNDDLKAILRSCSVRELIVTMRLMRSDKDTIGFDYSKVKKEELIIRAIDMAHYLDGAKGEKVIRQMVAAFSWKPADLAAKKSGVGGAGSGTDHKASSKDGKLSGGGLGRSGSHDWHGPAQGGSGDSDGGKRLDQDQIDAVREGDDSFEESFGLTKTQLMTYGQPTDEISTDWIGQHSVYFPALRRATDDWSSPELAAAAVERMVAKNLQVEDVEADANLEDVS